MSEISEFVKTEMKLKKITPSQKADKHDISVKEVKLNFTGASTLYDLNGNEIDSIEVKLSLKTGEKGFEKIKQLTQLQAIHQYSTLVLVPSATRDVDLSEEKITENRIALDNFIET